MRPGCLNPSFSTVVTTAGVVCNSYPTDGLFGGHLCTRQKLERLSAPSQFVINKSYNNIWMQEVRNLLQCHSVTGGLKRLLLEAPDSRMHLWQLPISNQTESMVTGLPRKMTSATRAVPELAGMHQSTLHMLLNLRYGRVAKSMIICILVPCRGQILRDTD